MVDRSIVEHGNACLITGKSRDLLVAVVAFLATWGFVHTQDPFFKVPPEYHLPMLGPPIDKWLAYRYQQVRVDVQNAALVFGILGGILGGGFAINRPSRLSRLGRLMSGCSSGFIVGAASGALGYYLQWLLTLENQLSTIHSSIINGALFASLGLGLGMAIGGIHSPPKNIVKYVFAGLVAGGVGGMLYPVAASLLIASVNIEAFIPAATSARVLWLGIGTLIIAALFPIDRLETSAITPGTN